MTDDAEQCEFCGRRIYSNFEHLCPPRWHVFALGLGGPNGWNVYADDAAAAAEAYAQKLVEVGGVESAGKLSDLEFVVERAGVAGSGIRFVVNAEESIEFEAAQKLERQRRT